MSEESTEYIDLDSQFKFDLWNRGAGAWNDWVTANPGAGLEKRTKKKKLPALESEIALMLWQEGKEAWNAWVAANTEAKISFVGEKFEAEKPKGRVVYGASEKVVDFSDHQFPNGLINFAKAAFSGGDVSFAGAKFGNGGLSFAEAEFLCEDVVFTGTHFGKGEVNFSNATFACDEVLFNHTIFEGSEVGFSNAEFYCHVVNFQFSSFEGPAHFADLVALNMVTQFSFEGARFDGLFHFSSESTMGCVLDLRRTKLSHDMVVQDIYCDFPRLSRKWFKKLATAQDGNDAQRFRKLKEIAVRNRNHAKALEFHVQEVRSRRGFETTRLQDAAQLVFWAFGDYGRSWLRPLGCMTAICLGFAGWFWSVRTPISKFANKDLAATAEASRDFLTAITYSVSNMLSFIPTGRTAKQQGEELLFGGTVPDEILLLSGAQSILAVILLFLLGLGLRNLFRV